MWVISIPRMFIRHQRCDTSDANLVLLDIWSMSLYLSPSISSRSHVVKASTKLEHVGYLITVGLRRRLYRVRLKICEKLLCLQSRHASGT